MAMAGTERRLALALVFVLALGAAAPAPSPVTPDLVAAAQKEGRVVLYTSIELRLAERLGHAFETKYPGVAVQVERSGAERNFQRIAQEEASNVHAADVVESSDIGHALSWKRDGMLAAYVPKDVARWPADARDPRWLVRRRSRDALGDGLQHAPCEARGCAQELCRSPRYQMDGEDRQGASRL